MAERVTCATQGRWEVTPFGEQEKVDA